MPGPCRRQRAHRQWATHPRPHHSSPSLQADRPRPCSVVVLTLHCVIARTLASVGAIVAERLPNVIKEHLFELNEVPQAIGGCVNTLKNHRLARSTVLTAARGREMP